MKKDADTLKTSVLIDEEERPLKSIDCYKGAIDHTFTVSPELKEYMAKNILISSGDWPTWYFEKKILAQVY